ncbi:hypothetical protein C8R44DRAFT_974420 [Mycena epipterygia]|nr:hypothetical protein C8R44DRAFT_974420 [Mycena epipterygia]
MNRAHPRSPSVHPSTRSPVEYIPNSPPKFNSPHDFPIMGPTPPWFKRRHNPPANASPSPQEFYMLPPLEIISVPRQAKYLTVQPPPEDAVLRDHVPRPKGSRPKSKPQNIVVPASRPIALATAHTPLSVPPSISAVFQAPSRCGEGDRSAPGTPGSPEPSPYIDPGLATGLPRALGLRAFPIRAERGWRHGG